MESFEASDANRRSLTLNGFKLVEASKEPPSSLGICEMWERKTDLHFIILSKVPMKGCDFDVLSIERLRA